MSAYQNLCQRFGELSDLGYLHEITSWDEQVMMPEGAGAARGQALASLKRLRHQLLTASDVKAWLQQAEAETKPSDWDETNFALMQREYLRASCVPDSLVQEATAARIACEQAWRSLRPANDWANFLPLLQKSFDLHRRMADIKSESLGLAPYDVLIDEYSPGVSQSLIDPLFQQLIEFLPDFTRRVQEQQANKTLFDVSSHYPQAKQRELGLQVMAALGFDFQHGRLDTSHHPFCGGVGSDVRITTRYMEDDFSSALMAVCHETGHALYEQGLPKDWASQPVGLDLGMSVHESQSLLIEMQACRSEAYAEFLLPLLQAQFKNLQQLNARDLHAHLIRVQPGFIRVDADELTYPLHVILRYEIERDLLADQLSLAELPERWDAAMQQYLGLSTAGNYRDGVMQDVHWAAGLFGYFPAYTLGRLIAAQLYQQAEVALPALPEQIRVGDFSHLVAWLRAHVHGLGSSLSMNALLTQVTGASLSCEAYIEQVKRRYSTV